MFRCSSPLPFTHRHTHTQTHTKSPSQWENVLVTCTLVLLGKPAGFGLAEIICGCCCTQQLVPCTIKYRSVLITKSLAMQHTTTTRSRWAPQQSTLSLMISTYHVCETWSSVWWLACSSALSLQFVLCLITQRLTHPATPPGKGCPYCCYCL